MSKNFRNTKGYVDSKIITYSIIGVGVLAVIVFSILAFVKSVDDNKNGQLNMEQIASITKNDGEEQKSTEKVNSDIGKNVDEAKKELEEKTNDNKNEQIGKEEIKVENIVDNQKEQSEKIKNENEKNNLNDTSNKNKELNESSKTTSTATSAEITKKENTEKNVTTQEKQKETVIRKELEFQKPVEGEIIQNFAKDNLIYSKTLEEWVTHLGIDIKAEKTTVVTSAEEGIVKTIKNDPRYGLTVIISHQDGFETLYANLLSSEFVKEGDKVTKGQAIGTVGNSGAFESGEEPHLHFEILRDSIQENPSIYIK